MKLHMTHKRSDLMAMMLFLLSLPLPIYAAPLKIAEWNMEWLHRNNNTGMIKRVDADYQAYLRYSNSINADIVVMEEVDGVQAAQRVLDPRKYNFLFTSRRNVQNVGIAYTNRLNLVSSTEIDALDVDGNNGLRYGLEMRFSDTQSRNNQEFIVLAVHLKSLCFDDSVTNPTNAACEKLSRQLVVLEDKINSYARSGIPFMIVGDFNRRFTTSDEFWNTIDDGVPTNADLYSPAMDHTSTCRGGQYPVHIDHIVLDKLATMSYVNNSFEEVDFTASDISRYKLSDHCPITLQVDFD